MLKKNGRFLCLTMFCIVYIVAFCEIGFYAYPTADDYSFSASISQLGFWDFQVSFYSEWQGRVLFNFLTALAYQLPMKLFYGVFPSLTLLTYILSLCFFMNNILSKSSFWERIFLSLLITSATLAVLPSLNETFYWLCGMPYFWTTTFMILILSLAVRAFRGGKIAFWLCLLLTFLNGTILELPCVFQGVVSFLVALYFLWRGERRKAAMSGAFWLASVAAFLVIYLAPGTAVRMGGLAQMPTLSHLIRTLAVASAFGVFTVVKFFIKPVVWAFLLFMPVIAKNVPLLDEKLAPRVRAWHIVLVTSLFAPLMQAIGGWAQGSGLELRGENLIAWMMGAVWVSLWSFGYRQEQGLEKIQSSRLFAWRWPLLLLSLLVSYNFIELIGDLKIAPHFAAENQVRDELMVEQREAGIQNVVLPRLETRPKLLFFNDLRPWPSNWMNGAFASYYGVETVSVLPSPLCEDEESLRQLREGRPDPLEKFAGQGDSIMCFLVGELYDPFFVGMEGVAKAPEKALQWYTRAAEDGNAQACRRLTRLYFLYDTSPQKYLKAAYWFMRSELALLRL